MLDPNGNLVRDARVYINSTYSVQSNSAGVFLIRNVPYQDVLLKATTDQDGVNFYGEQTVEMFSGERTKSVNITVVPTSQLATVRGTVHSNGGHLVAGARVWFNAGTESSTYTITDSNGNYRVDTLVGGLHYDVVATGASFNAGTDSITPVAGSTSELDLVLTTATDPNLNPPTGLSATAWTTPDTFSGFSPQVKSAYDRIKQIVRARNHKATGPQSRLTSGGNPIEVDLNWNPVSNNGLLGYGIYRRQGNNGTVSAIDFYKDPLATLYEDNDDALQQNTSYQYAMTSINSSFLDGSSHGESSQSAFVGVTTLGDQPVDQTTFGPTTFHWRTGSGATIWNVYVFDRFPSVDVDPIWSSPDFNGTSGVYSGPALTSGHTYFFIVIGTVADQSAYTLAPVLSFTQP